MEQLLLPYCCQSPLVRSESSFVFTGFAGKTKSRRADSNRLPLPSLRVIIHTLQGFARACKCPISKGFSLLRFAPCCTVLRSRWRQRGIRMSLGGSGRGSGTYTLRHSSGLRPSYGASGWLVLHAQPSPASLSSPASSPSPSHPATPQPAPQETSSRSRPPGIQ